MPNLNIPVSVSSIAFIDTQVENYQSLVAGVKPGTEVVVLDGKKDAIDQITQILADRTNIESIHIISHGTPGSLQLGKTGLSVDNLETYSQQLQEWRSAFTGSADILIYGCNVASGPRAGATVRRGFKPPSHSESRLKPTGNNSFIQSSLEDLRYETGNSFPGGTGEQARDLEIDGFTFIQRIAQLTNTNVAASKNLTGSVAKGGDWKLEAITGEIKTPLVFAEEVLAGYEYVLNSFGTANNLLAGTNPRAIAIGDFNKDGIPDLAVANVGSSDVSILQGDGLGSFVLAGNFPGGGGSSIAVADFNKDTNLDLAIATGNNISVLLGTGTGSFGTATSLGAGLNPSGIVAGDFNKDGNLDLAIANTNDTTISLKLGDGTGGFGPTTNFTVASFPYPIVTSDFNGDGNLDIAVASSNSGNFSILLGTGTGSFGPASNLSVAASPIYDLDVADFNGDNRVDLAIVRGSNVSILLGTGTGSFGPATDFPMPSNPVSVAIADLNGDSKLDLAVGRFEGQVSILTGNGTGNFSTTISLSATNSSAFPYIVAGDFNADGQPDLATANNSGSNDVSILLNIPNTVNFGAATYSDTEGTTDTVVSIPVTLSGGTPFADVTVPIAIDPSSTATENSDYTFSPTTVTFPAGTTTLTQDVAVTIKPDNLPENAETAILGFGTITGGIAGTTKQTTLTIAANGTVSYALAAGIASITEGNSGTKPLTFTATRSGNTGGASSVNYTIAGTATNVSDYNNIGGTSGATAATGTINFAADETSKTITLDVLGDTLVEPDETIAVTLSSPTGPGVTPTITTATATTTITNDDKAGFTINPTALTTSEVGGKAEFTVKLNSQPTADVTIGLRSDNLAEGTVSTNSLTFTSANYDQPQPITISGVDDLVADGPLPYKIVTAAAVSTDVIVISNKYETLDCTISTNNFIKRCARRRIHFSSL